MATHSSILAWGIPWTEEPGGYRPQGHKESDMTEATWHARMIYKYPVEYTLGNAGPNQQCLMFQTNF